MAITYNFSVNQMTCYPEHAGQSDVVFQVQWRYRGVNENNIGSSRGGTTELTYVAGSPFTPYKDLTEATVLGWVQGTLTPEKIAQMETEIVGDINWQIQQANSNTPIMPPLPWPQDRV